MFVLHELIAEGLFFRSREAEKNLFRNQRVLYKHPESQLYAISHLLYTINITRKSLELGLQTSRRKIA